MGKKTFSRKQLTPAQKTECMRVGRELEAAWKRTGMSRKDCAAFLKIEPTYWTSNLRTLKDEGKGYQSLSRPLGWIEKLEKFNKPRPKAVAKPESMSRGWNWPVLANEDLIGMIANPNLSEKERVALSQEIDTRLYSPPVVQIKEKDQKILTAFVVDLNEENLSTSMVGEDAFNLPGDALLLKKSDDGYKVFIVKSAVEDPRMKLAKEQAQCEIDTLKSRIGVLEMENHEHREWRGNFSKLFPTAAAPALTPGFEGRPIGTIRSNGENKHELVTSG